MLSGDYGLDAVVSSEFNYVGDHLMDFSFLRALRASVRLTLGTIQKDAKRLQRATGDVFGRDYPLSACQEAYARARGFRSWHEAQTVLERASRSASSTPFWTIASRNDVHQAVFTALAIAEIDMSENGPVVFSGEQKHAARPAACLWFEMMSAASIPGLALVDTQAAAFQDTEFGRAVDDLGLQEIVEQCRFVDLREQHQPIAISTSAFGWTMSLISALSEPSRERFRGTGMQHLLQSMLVKLVGDNARSEYGIFIDSVETVVQGLCSSTPHNPSAVLSEEGVPGDSLAYDFNRYIKDRDNNAAAELLKLVRDASAKGVRLGTVLVSESTRRPTVVLFDGNKPDTVLLAGVIHSLYYWRYAGHELRARGISTRPVVYFNDQDDFRYPDFLVQCGSGFTCVAAGDKATSPGEEKSVRNSRTRSVYVDDASLIYCGRRVELQRA